MSLAEAKSHLRIDHFDDDDLIGGLILAVESRLDGYSGLLGRCMINQVWTLKTECWPLCGLPLVFPDVSAVEVGYLDADGNQQTLVDASYRILEGHSCSFLDWTDSFSAPSLAARPDAVQVDVTCGYGADASEVPEMIRHAAKLLLGVLYENREAVSANSTVELPMSFSFDALISPFRRREV